VFLDPAARALRQPAFEVFGDELDELLTGDLVSG
jgi:hypothetical protein